MKRILGNEELIKHFKTAFIHKKISHAYILEGERGSGKKTIAEALAALLQCESPVEEADGPAACGNCQSCIMMKHRDHPDVIRIRHEKPAVISVGDIREQLVNTAEIIPYRGPYKIYIMDEAEKMNQAAQNALLKTIEEPPEYVVILLLASNRGAFLSTILSRCILLDVKPVPDKTVRECLQKECGVSKETAEFCSGFAMGNIGRAKEAALSEEFHELAEFTLSLLRFLNEFTDYEITARVKELQKWKDSIQDYLDLMQIWYRDILVIKSVEDPEKLIFKSEYMTLAKQSRALSYEDFKIIMELIEEARARIRANVNFESVMSILHIGIRNRFDMNR